MTEFFSARGIPVEVKAEFKLVCLKRHESLGRTVARLMIEYVAMSGYSTSLWPGYERVKWADVKSGETVWIAEACGGTPYAYGPHLVINPETKTLQNVLGTAFVEPKEILLKRKGE